MSNSEMIKIIISFYNDHLVWTFLNNLIQDETSASKNERAVVTEQKR